MLIHSNHPYHLVEKSPWPILASLGAIFITTGLLKWFHNYDRTLLLIGLFRIFIIRYQWFRDVSRESSLQGLHTLKVTQGLRWGIILFIISEILFFFSFFWAFYHRSLNSTLELGLIWPPEGVIPFNAFQIPLLNTAILLASGVTVTWAHHRISENIDKRVTQSLLLTIVLGVYFTGLQVLEYYEATFTIRDRVYGTTFFVATGFHGLHVIIGSTFLFACLFRVRLGHFTRNHHIGFEGAIWYWHFVDVVWLFLYTSIYWWGS